MTYIPKVQSGSRLGSMILDHFCMTLLAMIFFIPLLVQNISGAFTVSHTPSQPVFGGPLLLFALFGFAIYLCKDVIQGRSIGKRVTNTQVVDTKTGLAATPLQTLIRNITCAIWPVEVIITLFNPERRIGDRIAGTRIALYDPNIDPGRKSNIRQIVIALSLAYMVIATIALSLQTISPKPTQVKFVESSYNKLASNELEKLFADSLDNYLTPNVRIYDSIEHKKRMYISIIFTLKENYLADEAQNRELRAITDRLLYAKHSKESFTGEAKYVFKEDGAIQMSTNSIGTD